MACRFGKFWLKIFFFTPVLLHVLDSLEQSFSLGGSLGLDFIFVVCLVIAFLVVELLFLVLLLLFLLHILLAPRVLSAKVLSAKVLSVQQSNPSHST